MTIYHRHIPSRPLCYISTLRASSAEPLQELIGQPEWDLIATTKFLGHSLDLENRGSTRAL